MHDVYSKRESSHGVIMRASPASLLLFSPSLNCHHHIPIASLMTTIIITHTAPPCSPIMKITLTSTNPKAELASSLSGNLVEYQFGTSSPGKMTLTAVDSYKERFRKTKAKLEEVVEEHRKLEEDMETLWHAHVYTKILAGKPLAAYAPFDSPTSLHRAS